MNPQTKLGTLNLWALSLRAFGRNFTNWALRLVIDPVQPAQLLGEYISQQYGCSPETLKILAELKGPLGTHNEHSAHICALQAAADKGPSPINLLFAFELAKLKRSLCPKDQDCRDEYIRAKALVVGKRPDVSNAYQAALENFRQQIFVDRAHLSSSELARAAWAYIQFNPHKNEGVHKEIVAEIEKIGEMTALRDKLERGFACVLKPENPRSDNTVRLYQNSHMMSRGIGLRDTPPGQVTIA